MPIPSDLTLTNLSKRYIEPGWYPGGFIDQFIRKLPFQRIEQPTTELRWNQANSLTVPSIYQPSPTLPESAMDTTQQSATMQRIGDIALVDYLSQQTSGDPNDLLATQIEAKKIGIIRALATRVLQDNGGLNLNGLPFYGTGAQSINVTANNLPSLDDLHLLVNMVRASDGSVGGGADCIVTSERVIRYIVKLLEGRDDVAPSTNKGAPGGSAAWVYDPDLGVPVPTFRGIPMYAGQALDDATFGIDIWALKLTGPTGVRLLHATGSSEEFGIEVVPVPLRDNKAQIGAFVGGIYALLVPEARSVARMRNTFSSALTTQGIKVLP